MEKYTLLIGFELRIFLSKLSGQFLKVFSSQVLVNGNEIIFNGNTFSVDPSCEGLKFFTGVLLLLLCFQNTYLLKGISQSKFIVILLAWIFSILLWLWANLVRIILLVLFSIPSDSFLHSLIGIFCFVFIVGIPFTLIWFYWIESSSILFQWQSSTSERNDFNYPQMFLLLLPIILSGSILYRSKNFASPVFEWQSAYGEFARDNPSLELESQFYRNKNATLILKKNLPFLGLGHHPKICFQSVGYTFQKEEEISISETESIRTAELEKDGKKYLLSWWYTREAAEGERARRTSSEWIWRKQILLTKEKFIQVNLITNSKKEASKIYKELAKKGL